MGVEGQRYAQVAVDAAVGKRLDYAVPEELRDRLRVGSRVWVPLGSRKVQGTVTAFPPKPAFPKLKAIIAPIGTMGAIDASGGPDVGFVVPPNLMELARWMADYYMADLGATLKTVVPASVRKPSPPAKVVRVAVSYTHLTLPTN